MQEAIESAFPLSDLSQEASRVWEKHFHCDHLLYTRHEISDLKNKHRDYLKCDLGYYPLRQYILPSSVYGAFIHAIEPKTIANISFKDTKSLLETVILKGYDTLAKLSKLDSPEKRLSGLLFPTRPVALYDLYILHNDPFSKAGSEEIASCLLAFRGFEPTGMLPAKNELNDTIQVAFDFQDKEKIRIAVTGWQTTIESWKAAATGKFDTSTSRLGRLNHLLNSVIRSRQRPRYLILPELSIPAHWFLAIVGKLKSKGISLICGIEYQHGPKKTVHNQVWAAFPHDALGFTTTMIYRQDKQNPALHEEKELHQISGKTLKPLLKTTIPSILNHGGFQFAILICSELTNVDYRSALRGKIDALFIPEWNKDIESFNTLIESSAIDIHSYIIQCNDRQYGDSRIRAPYKDNWKRDIIRVKGGIEDYFVIGEIDIKSLRAFQSGYRSPPSPFKPVPDGFTIADERKTLPLQ